MLAAVSVNEIEILGPCEVGSPQHRRVGDGIVQAATAILDFIRWSMEYPTIRLEKTSLTAHR